MCIIFSYFDTSCLCGDYKLIIAANRDEYYERPSTCANFLVNHPHVLCGLDMKSGVEGGTWLGVTTKGKFAFLTNYLMPIESVEGKSRGVIVKDYLLSTSFMGTREYIETNLKPNFYRPFNFIGGQFVNSGNEIDMAYYSSEDSASPYKLSNGSYILACTQLNTLWKKVKHGSNIFENILDFCMPPSTLTDDIINNLLSDTTCLYPDELVRTQCKSRLNNTFLKSYCSVMIKGLKGYGTRAQTVVLVDKDNHLYFTEKSLRFDDDESTSWITHSYSFCLDLNS